MQERRRNKNIRKHGVLGVFKGNSSKTPLKYNRKRLFTDSVSVNKMHLTDTVSVNKMHLTDSVSVNKMHLIGTLYGKPFSKTSKTSVPPLYIT